MSTIRRADLDDAKLATTWGLDYGSEVPCDWGEIDGCSSTAAWVNTSACCGLVTLHCPPHRVRHDELTIQYAGEYRCIRCQAGSPGYTWRPL